MKTHSVMRSTLLLVAVGGLLLPPRISRAQRTTTTQDTQAARAARRAAFQNMTPAQQQQYMAQRQAEWQARFNALPPAVKAAILARRQQMQQEQAQEQATTAQAKALMTEVGLDDPATQDAIAKYLVAELRAKRRLLQLAQTTAAGIKDTTIKDDDVAGELAEFRMEVAADKTRHEAALADLDKTVSYTTKPRIEAFLTMLSATGPEAARVGSPAVLFARPKPAATEATTTTTDAAKTRADQERAFMNVLQLTDKDTQDAVIAFVQKENDARLPLLATAQKLTSLLKGQQAGATTKAAAEGAGDKATVTLVDDATPPAANDAPATPATDQQISDQLAQFHKQSADDMTRYNDDLAELDKQIGYTTKPRLGTFLTMVELVGDEAAYVGGPSAIFGTPIPRFGRGGQNGGNNVGSDGLPSAFGGNAPTTIYVNVGADGLPNLVPNAAGGAQDGLPAAGG